MKKILAAFLALSVVTAAATVAQADEYDYSAPAPTESKAKAAGGNFTVGVGPIGNVFVVDSRPELSPGVGGFVFFDYRWSPQFSTQFTFLISDQDGTGISAGDDNILFLGIPTFDLKFYLLKNPSRWDPYGLVGVGFFMVSEGGAGNGSQAFGIGADIGLGTDFYISEKFSVGLSCIFRSIGLIDSVDGPNNGTALFPVSFQGNFAYHF
ncbi:MAG TPA: outer membrane beta-barrel protein [bacterium]|nr:outer membrane beta-barrel protein [bacterium]